MKIRIDERKCQGFGMCANAAPDVFAVGENDGYAYLKVGSGDEADPATHLRTASINRSSEDVARIAIAVCPMQAIEALDE
jgi:ferredoxin